MKKLILLGASGSIGEQTINVVKNHSDKFSIVGISIGNRIERIDEYLEVVDFKYVCIKNKEDVDLVKDKYPNLTVYYGDEGLIELCNLDDYDILVNALVGSVGLKPTLAAIENKKNIALANKETLVVGGQFVKEALKVNNVNLYPIDSEHSAIFQCLQGNKKEQVNKIIITASGGSFRDKTRDELKDVTVDQALNHPNWSMGAKITIDSATMMNKGLEIIEAHYLFDLSYDKIEAIIHPQSIVHSLVQYNDLSLIAQLGTADMKLPIQYALSYPNRLELFESESLDLTKVSKLEFKELDFIRYPLVKIAYECGRKEGNSLVIMNAANEVAVNLFLEKKIKFLDIETLVIKALNNIEFIDKPTLDEIFNTDKITREYVLENWKGI